jgi:hypothetical protein
MHFSPGTAAQEPEWSQRKPAVVICPIHTVTPPNDTSICRWSPGTALEGGTQCWPASERSGSPLTALASEADGCFGPTRVDL